MTALIAIGGFLLLGLLVWLTTLLAPNWFREKGPWLAYGLPVGATLVAVVTLVLVLLNLRDESPIEGQIGGTAARPDDILVVNSYAEATRLLPGMVYGEDFVFSVDYMSDFVRIVKASNITVSGGSVSFELDQSPAYSPYVLWICYPEDGRISRAIAIALVDIGGSPRRSGKLTVLGKIEHKPSSVTPVAPSSEKPRWGTPIPVEQDD